MTMVIVTAVEMEARAIGELDGVRVVVAGIGRTNAAAATTQALLEARSQGDDVSLVMSAGVAGALPSIDRPGYACAIGDVVMASSCVYMEEGVITPEGFADTTEMGFPLGDWSGNAVPVDVDWLARYEGIGIAAPIATVATCSGTDAVAMEVAQRTQAVAEAMEGAAVVHAARRLGVSGLEVRTISNTTGDRDQQQWDLSSGLDALQEVIKRIVAL